jgi:hypothetical protein
MYVKEKFSRFLILMIFVFVLVLYSCQGSTLQPTKSVESVQPTTTTENPAIFPTSTSVSIVEPTPTAWPTATLSPAAPVPTDTQVAQVGQDIQVSFGGVSFTVAAGIATSVRSVVEPSIPISADLPYFGQWPSHLIFYLDGYQIAKHFHTARIEVYPADLLARYSPGSAEYLPKVKDTIATGNLDQKEIPFLPLVNAAQVLHTRQESIDFKNGGGYRFLTVYSQAFMPVTNYELFYAYQGLTSDGKYLVAAYLPINAPILQADSDSTEAPPGGIPFVDTTKLDPNSLEAYNEKVSQALNGLQPGVFTPDLNQIDAMMKSLRIENVVGLVSECPALLQQNTRAYVSLHPPVSNNLRAGPSKGEQVVGTLNPGTVVEISSGPVCENGLIFWNVHVPDQDKSGWTAESDLKEQWLLPCPKEGACPPDWAR